MPFDEPIQPKPEDAASDVVDAESSTSTMDTIAPTQGQTLDATEGDMTGDDSGDLAPIELSTEQVAILMAEPTDEELELKPDQAGSVFISHTVCRARLNKAFKPFGWRLQQVGRVIRDPSANILYREFVLWVAVGGKWHRGPKALGEQQWLGGTGRSTMTWGDAIEGCESIGLSRCCKRIGMVIDRRRADRFKQEKCVRVLVEERPKDGSARGEFSVAWRRLDAPSLVGELDAVNDSPNRAKYSKPPEPYWRAKAAKDAAKQATAPKAQPASAPAGQKAIPKQTGETITKPESKQIWANVLAAGLDEQAVVEMLKTRYHVNTTGEILKKDLVAIMAWIAKGGD
jgi:hypothetical protein